MANPWDRITPPSGDLERYVFFRDNPWQFLLSCVQTEDAVDRKNPIKLLPNREYAYRYTQVWYKYPLMAIPKSRRMTMSWFTIALYVHDTIFNVSRKNAFVSKKEDDADDLVRRAKFIFEHIPEEMIPKHLLPKMEYKFNNLNFPELGSWIRGFPQGADQLRQFTLSGVFGDESAFWEQAEEFYSATFPVIEGGGRMTLVSSPAPGFFKKLCFDAMSHKGDINVENHEPDRRQLMQGLNIWKNPKNNFMVFELHYSADPKKRSPEFKESIKASMPLQKYLREYELVWDTWEGLPVYPEFGQLHILHKQPEPHPGIPMLIGFDFGLTPAAIIGQLQEDQLVIFDEIVEINMGATRFYEKVREHINLYYPAHTDLRKDWLCFIDPAGLQKAQSNESTCAQALSGPDGRGFVPRPGPVNFEARRKAVADYLMKLAVGAKPAFQIYQRGAPMLTKGFLGGYKFAEKGLEREQGKLQAVKDEYSHPHDALQYLCAGAKDVTSQMKRSIPRPVYNVRGNRRG